MLALLTLIFGVFPGSILALLRYSRGSEPDDVRTAAALGWFLVPIACCVWAGVMSVVCAIIGGFFYYSSDSWQSKALLVVGFTICFGIPILVMIGSVIKLLRRRRE